MEAINSKIKSLESQALNIRQDFLSGFDRVKRDSRFGFLQKRLSGKEIIACGMGGSILAAEIFQDSFFAVVEDYSLPKIKDRNNTVVFCFSYSGNTEETLACAKQAKKLGLKTFGFSRGGKLRKIVDEFFEVPDLKLPRFAVPYWLGLIQGLLAPRHRSGSILDLSNGLTPRQTRLTKMSDKLKLNVKRIAGQAKVLAKKLDGKKILIYAPNRFRPLAHFWEVNLDETSKVPSFIGSLPDIDHHDLASFSRHSIGREFAAIFFDDGSFLSRRVFLTAKIFKNQLKINSIVLKVSGREVFKNLLLGYLVSLALAQQGKVDPFENFLQEQLKKQLNRG
jgi:glucose/mannose-6-phosphate isomerase